MSTKTAAPGMVIVFCLLFNRGLGAPGLFGGFAIEAGSADQNGACCWTCQKDPLACHFLNALG